MTDPAPAPRGLIIAAAASASGKSTLTMGLLRALHRRGVGVQPFKCGPDYIDPAFHAAACGRTSYNLDVWAMRPAFIEQLIMRAASGADLCIAEGVMGLFDGAKGPGKTGTGSTADFAMLSGWPVVLVLDVAAQAETAAAVTLGMHTYRKGLPIAGVILNRVGGPGHIAMVAEAIANLDIPVIGAIPRTGDAQLGSRHLGLVQAQELADLDTRIDAIARAIDDGLDLNRLTALAQPLNVPDYRKRRPLQPLPPPGQRIAIAKDRAFSFLYPHLLDAWRAAGAEILPFSPLADEAPDATCDAVWLPGGYPELHAGQLTQAANFRAGMHRSAARGAVIHGECGGYMVLGEGLEDADGQRFAMLGLLGLETSFKKRRLNLGYRRVELLEDDGTPAPDARFTGHEFHYTTVIANPDAPYAVIHDASGQRAPDQGARRGKVTGTFFHVLDRAD